MDSLCRILASLPYSFSKLLVRCLSGKIVPSRIIGPTTNKANNYNGVSHFHSSAVNFGKNIILISSGEQFVMDSTKQPSNEDLDLDKLVGRFNSEIRDMIKNRSMKNDPPQEENDDDVLSKLSHGDYFFSFPISDDITYFHVTARGSYLTFEETYGEKRPIFSFYVDRELYHINSMYTELENGMLTIYMKLKDLKKEDTSKLKLNQDMKEEDTRKMKLNQDMKEEAPTILKARVRYILEQSDGTEVEITKEEIPWQFR